MTDLVLHTFGDSVLDCARYNPARITPAALLARNHNALFPEFRAQDLRTLLGVPVSIDHRATDGATAEDILGQLTDVEADPDAEHIALVSIGGNDLLTYMNPVGINDFTVALAQFDRQYEQFLSALTPMPTYLLNVYDPSFGDDERNILNLPFYAVESVSAEFRKRHAQVNESINILALAFGHTVLDLHKHFLTGTPEWYSNVIEPSMRGCSEIRRLVLDAVIP